MVKNSRQPSFRISNISCCKTIAQYTSILRNDDNSFDCFNGTRNGFRYSQILFLNVNETDLGGDFDPRVRSFLVKKDSTKTVLRRRNVEVFTVSFARTEEWWQQHQNSLINMNHACLSNPLDIFHLPHNLLALICK